MVLLYLTACEAAPPWPAHAATPRDIAPAVLFVGPPGPLGAAADGSAAKPFGTIAEAVRAAPAGALLRIAEGTYPETLVLEKAAVLVGAGVAKTRLVGPAGQSAPVVRVQGDARVELRDLAIENGAVGVSVERGGVRLQGVALRELTTSALLAHDAEVAFIDGEMLVIGGGKEGVAVRIDGGSLEMRRSVLRRAGRRAIEIRRGRGLLEAVEVSDSALAALQALDGAEVTIEGGRFERIGGSALYAGAAKLTVKRASVSNAEYGAVGFRGAELEFLVPHRKSSIRFARAHSLSTSITIENSCKTRTSFSVFIGYGQKTSLHPRPSHPRLHHRPDHPGTLPVQARLRVQRPLARHPRTSSAAP